MYVCMYVCIYVCMYEYLYGCDKVFEICMSKILNNTAGISLCYTFSLSNWTSNVCMYVCMYVCTCMYIQYGQKKGQKFNKMQS